MDEHSVPVVCPRAQHAHAVVVRLRTLGQHERSGAFDQRLAIQLPIKTAVCAMQLICSKSDPLGVLYELQDGSWREAGRTELIANSLSKS